MIIQIQYGKGHVELDANPSFANWHVVQPKQQEPIQDLDAAFQQAFTNPIGCPPISELIKPTDRLVIVTSDGTRSVPNQILLKQLIKFLNIPIENITVLLGNGTHRRNTPKEIEEMFGYELANSLRILNHDSYNNDLNILVGKTESRGNVYINKHYVKADKRIVLGSIEPHFFAGFSGGAKGIVPAIAGLETIFHLHRAELISNPKSTWGEVENNPIHREILEMASLCPPDFLINVSLNTEKQITGIFAGNYIDAHKLGCEKVKENSFIKVSKKFPVVITSNSGYPLDQNLYQTVKGISAASQIVEDNGTIFVASECSDGISSEGNFAKLLQGGNSIDYVLQSIFLGQHCIADQWQVQVLAAILKKANVFLYSTLQPETVESCKMKPVQDFQSTISEHIQKLNPPVDIAVLPNGPLTVPYVG